MTYKREELEELLKYARDIYCQKCGAVLQATKLKSAGFNVHNGKEKYKGAVVCPNDRWWKWGHTYVHIYYNGVELQLHEYDGGSVSKQLLPWDLEEERDKVCKIAEKALTGEEKRNGS